MSTFRMIVDGEPSNITVKALDWSDAVSKLEQKYDWFYWFVRAFPGKTISFENVD